MTDPMTRRCSVAAMLAIALAGSLAALAPRGANAVLPVEAAKGYVLNEVCSGYTERLDIAPLFPGGPLAPTSIAHGNRGEIFIAFQTGKIVALYPKRQCEVRELADLNSKEANAPKGLAVHPRTGDLYVMYQVGPDSYPDPDVDPEATKSAIAIVGRGGALEKVADGLNSMMFDGIPAPIGGSQGGDFDSEGNLYFAQGVNDVSRERWDRCRGAESGGDECAGASDSDEWQSSIMRLDADGSLSVWSSGHRAPYDVVVAEEDEGGTARYVFVGDNGAGEDCANEEALADRTEVECIEEFGSRPTFQLYDELNRAFEGSFHGFPEGYPPIESEDQADWRIPESHVAALWNLGKVDALPDDDVGFDWPVPTGIDYMAGKWGEFDDPVFMALFNCTSIAVTDLGTVDVFHGPHQSQRTTLLRYVDGAIDVRWGPDKKLYVAQYGDGAIYTVQPE